MKPTLPVPILLLLMLLTALGYSTDVKAQPLNNNCATATLLTSATSCNNVGGTVQAATNSGVAVAPCTGNPDDDVWYRFVSASTDQTITISNIGNNLNTSGVRMQLFSGTCGSLVSEACGTTSISVTNLARNTTYYIRVYSAGSTPLNSNAGFNICVTHPNPPAPLIDFGKSYVNTSKPTGGTVEQNDILEIRASIAVRGGSFDSCRFTDIIPTGTTYIPGTLRILTNEGKIYKQFTDLQYDASNDEGWISGTAITMNLGYTATDQPASLQRRGRIRNNNGHRPTFYGSSCIMIASYRVQVTVPNGSIINTGGGNITYTTAPPTITTFTYPSRPVSVYTNIGICPNSIGVNSLGTEFNGTFGNGVLRNRGSSTNVPAGYTYSGFWGANMPNDYYYAIANNTSTQMGYSTSNNWLRPDPDPDGGGPLTTHRVFSVWDIVGDHTGATNPLLGNSAADTTGGRRGGYMLVINAAYRIDSAFQHTITGLCSNTYYEISVWMRNICAKCGCDVNGVGATSGNNAYIPTALNDSAGVRPNLAFALDGVDYYTSGDILHTGQWVKKGFTFRTGPSQTSFAMRFYNNAPGGGGNDWVLDDISVATCSPNMTYAPTLNPIICEGNPLLLSDTVKSFFNNYNYYIWQRSTDNGATWTNVTAPGGPSTPVWNGSAWQYVTNYTVPPANTQLANSLDQYRVVVATTATNLTDVNCRFTDAGNIITMNVIDCGTPLGIKLLNFSGKLINGKAKLDWSTSNEFEELHFDIERSDDGINFSRIGVSKSYNEYGPNINLYDYLDAQPVNSATYYRVRIYNTVSKYSYTRTIQLNQAPAAFSFASVINPFSDQLRFEINAAKNCRSYAELIDPSGNAVRKSYFDLLSGTNRLSFNGTGGLTAGLYILKIRAEGIVTQRMVFKQNN